MDLSGVVPLPISVVEDKAAAFLPLAGEAALSRVVTTLLGAVTDPGRIVVAAAGPLVHDVRESLATQGRSSVTVLDVGDEPNRADCIAAALAYLGDQASPTSHVLVHDVSQPLSSAEAVDRVVVGLRSGGRVVMPALSVTDSVKAVDEHGSVTATVDRSALRTVQYPRGFAADQLAQLLSQAGPTEFDELDAALNIGVPIAMVYGDADGLRAELPRDAQFVEALIESRLRDPHGA